MSRTLGFYVTQTVEDLKMSFKNSSNSCSARCRCLSDANGPLCSKGGPRAGTKTAFCTLIIGGKIN